MGLWLGTFAVVLAGILWIVAISTLVHKATDPWRSGRQQLALAASAVVMFAALLSVLFVGIVGSD